MSNLFDDNKENKAVENVDYLVRVSYVENGRRYEERMNKDGSLVVRSFPVSNTPKSWFIITAKPEIRRYYELDCVRDV